MLFGLHSLSPLILPTSTSSRLSGARCFVRRRRRLQTISGPRAWDLCFLVQSTHLHLIYRLDCWIARGGIVDAYSRDSAVNRERERERDMERKQGREGFSITTTNQPITHLNITQMDCLISCRIYANTEDLSLNLLFIIKTHRK